jgi:flagellar hook-associated protein 2
MSTSQLGVSSTSSAPITVTGLASGLNTTAIIAALINVQREPVVHLSDEQAKLQAAQTQLTSIQSSLQQLSLAVSEFSLPFLFETSQTVTSNEPLRVSAAVTSGAAIGGYEVEVTKLAKSAQRTFTFKSPTEEDTITIDGQELVVKAGETAKGLAEAINSDSQADVYAAVVEGGTLVLSTRATGNTGGEFIEVTDPGETLTEVEGTAKAGEDAEFTVDGVPATSSSNTVTDAIAGVTVTLTGLTPGGPVTIDVQAPAANAGAVEAQVQSFIKLYNSTVGAIQQQLATKPPARPQSTSEFGTGTLFADVELTSLLDQMRATMYEPIAGLEAGMSSPFDIGVSTGAPTGGSTSQASLEGMLTLDPTKLAEAVETNPAGTEKMLRGWSQSLKSIANAAAQPGGAIEDRVNGDAAQITALTSEINRMNETLAAREKALQATYAELESVISKNSALGTFLTQQTEALKASTG